MVDHQSIEPANTHAADIVVVIGLIGSGRNCIAVNSAGRLINITGLVTLSRNADDKRPLWWSRPSSRNLGDLTMILDPTVTMNTAARI